MKKVALTIAGFDPSGGAGILSDCKTFHTHGVYGLSVITAITVQNSQKVYAVDPVKEKIVREQLCRLLDDFKIDAIKIGMLCNRRILDAILEPLSQLKQTPIILDPVLVSTSGHRLLEEEGVKLLIDQLMPMVTLITPNIAESELLSGEKIQTSEAMEKAAKAILDAGATGVVVKGGHATGNPDDLFMGQQQKLWFEGVRIPNRSTHGTGCIFSSAIAANLALGKTMPESIAIAKKFITTMIQEELKLGKGDGLPDHFVSFMPGS